MCSLSETNVLHTQLHSGQMEVGTISDAVKESGVIDLTLKENKEDSTHRSHRQ